MAEFANEDLLEIVSRATAHAILGVSDIESPSRSAGRPRIDVDMDYAVELLFDLHLPLARVANICGVSRPTLYSRLQEEGINMTYRRYTEISDEDLKKEVEKIKQLQPHAGLSYLTGHLRSRGVFVQRHRVLEMLHLVDPEGVLERQRGVTVRREYSVPCPNYIWHIDGHHKLINWKFVIHAAVDGFSRCLVFINCSDNNLSSTVEHLFLEATEQYDWPLRVRTDYGGENVGVWRQMETYRGQGHKSVLAGSSVHNTRVERMHRDVKEQVVEPFKTMFLDMEARSLLDRENWVDLFCLHFVFLPRVNAALQQFRAGHNSHAIRTEHNRSPLELFSVNRHLTCRYQHEDIADVHAGLSVQELQQCDLPYVPVNRTACPLRRPDMDQLRQAVDPLSDTENPIDMYLRVTDFVKDCLLRYDTA